MSKESNLLKCKCGYEWETKSQMQWATCPSCRLKVKNERKTDTSKNDLQGEIKESVV